MTQRADACSSPADELQVLAASDSWRSDAFAGATGGVRCPALASMVVRTLVGIGSLEWQFVLATTNSAARSDVGLGCCHRSRCSSVGFAGSYLLRGLMDLNLLAG